MNFKHSYHIVDLVVPATWYKNYFSWILCNCKFLHKLSETRIPFRVADILTVNVVGQISKFILQIIFFTCNINMEY